MSRPIIFADAEFPGLSPNGTHLLSLALIKESGEELYIEFDYRGKTNAWVKKHVLPSLSGKKVSQVKAKKLIRAFVGKQEPYFLSYVNAFDWMAILKLFGVHKHPFYWIPLDLASLFYARGINVRGGLDGVARRLGIKMQQFTRHNALDDARLVKMVYEKLMV
ncbi:MAG TPA: hypothetical protein VJB87_01020 [Candidatus Nanoarchaeia archaeon]|nr:hypothetical protein [Candidatus Nanoarchaeia archaeon]